jgi:hypothetical protein
MVDILRKELLIDFQYSINCKVIIPSDSLRLIHLLIVSVHTYSTIYLQYFLQYITVLSTNIKLIEEEEIMNVHYTLHTIHFCTHYYSITTLQYILQPKAILKVLKILKYALQTTTNNCCYTILSCSYSTVVLVF